MRKKIALACVIALFFSGNVISAQLYRFHPTGNSFVNVCMDKYVDNRDGNEYRVFTAEKVYGMDTARVDMFADNLRYITVGSTCNGNSCNTYGRYYPKSEVSDDLCPDGWYIATAEQMALMASVEFKGDTIHSGSWTTRRTVSAFPEVGSTYPRHDRLPDIPSGWFDASTGTIKYAGKIGSVWVLDDTQTDYTAVLIDFMLVTPDTIEHIYNMGAVSSDNRYPIKCFRSNAKQPDKYSVLYGISTYEYMQKDIGCRTLQKMTSP